MAAQNIQQRYTIAGRETVSPTQIVKTVTLTTVPEAITATATYASQMIILGKNAVRTNNTGSVWLQFGLSADSAGTYEITSGGEVWFTAQEGGRFNLADIYVDVANANDGVVVLYW